MAWPQPHLAGLCTVCINCGYTVSAYSNPAVKGSEEVLIGSTWAPACPAVKRLRECVRASQQPARHPLDDSDESAAGHDR